MITGIREIAEAAHIYPLSMGKYLQMSNLPTSIWGTLRNFWSEERVDSWYNAIFPSGTEVVHNLICLSPDAHKFHQKACFALEPREISDNKERLKVKFFWLRQYKQFKGAKVDILSRPSLPGNLDPGSDGLGLLNVRTSGKICSGDEIWLETEDPESLPLPDWRLLEMQWFLNRVTAMSGAAEPRDDLDEDDDGWEVSLENEEVLEPEDEWNSSTSYSPSSPQQLLRRSQQVDQKAAWQAETLGREQSAC